MRRFIVPVVIVMTTAASLQASLESRLLLFTSVQAPYQFTSINVDQPALPGSGSTVAVGDFDGNGATDVLAGNAGRSTADHVKVFQSGIPTSVRGFNPVVPAGLPGAGSAFGRYHAAGQLGGTGAFGFTSAAGLGEPGYIQSYSLSKEGAFAATSPAFAPWGASFDDGIRVAAGDVDGDGVNEVAASTNKCYVGHVTLIKREIGTPPRRVVTIDPFAAPVGTVTMGEIGLDMADINRDGRAELAALGTDAAGVPQLKLFSFANNAAGGQLDELLNFSWGTSQPQSMTDSSGLSPGGGVGHVTLIKREIAPPIVVVSTNNGIEPVVSSFELLADPLTGAISLGAENRLNLAFLKAQYADLNASWENVSFSVSGMETLTSADGGSYGLLLGLSPILAPEPTALGLLGGLSLLAARRRK